MAATENPFESLHNALTSSAKVYALTTHDAWVYGIIVGWAATDFEQLQELHKWSDATCARLKRLHERYAKWTATAAKGYVDAFAKGFGKKVSVKPLTVPQVIKASKQNDTVWIRHGETLFCARLADVVTDPDNIEAWLIGDKEPALYSLRQYGRPTMSSTENWTAYACLSPEITS